LQISDKEQPSPYERRQRNHILLWIASRLEKKSNNRQLITYKIDQAYAQSYDRELHATQKEDLSVI
jgi:hypothetical protein